MVVSFHIDVVPSTQTTPAPIAAQEVLSMCLLVVLMGTFVIPCQ